MLQKATGSTASKKRMEDMVNKVTVTKGDRTKEVTMKRAERMSKRGWEGQETPKWVSVPMTQAHLETHFTQKKKTPGKERLKSVLSSAIAEGAAEGVAEMLKSYPKSELTRTTSKIPKYKSKKEVKKIIKTEKKRKNK